MGTMELKALKARLKNFFPDKEKGYRQHLKLMKQNCLYNS